MLSTTVNQVKGAVNPGECGKEGSIAKEQEDFTEEVTEVGFEGCPGVSQEDKVWIGVGKVFFFGQENSFFKGMETGNSDMFGKL